jgi:hypothetical protein
LDSSQGKEEDTVNIGVLVDCVDLVPKPKVSVCKNLLVVGIIFILFLYKGTIFQFKNGCLGF